MTAERLDICTAILALDEALEGSTVSSTGNEISWVFPDGSKVTLAMDGFGAGEMGMKRRLMIVRRVGRMRKALRPRRFHTSLN